MIGAGDGAKPREIIGLPERERSQSGAGNANELAQTPENAAEVSDEEERV